MRSEPQEASETKQAPPVSHGGDQIAKVLHAHGVRFLFTLCGGHISPILVGSKRLGIRVIDVRHEANAVFAADAVARLTGIPGIAAVTAGPGLTNSITALKNAQLAQSPLVLLGGAAATVLRGRGSLQDIDQRALIAPHVKEVFTVEKVRDLAPAVDRALWLARSGVPGPVFVECPIDLLYGEELVKDWYGQKGAGKSLAERAMGWYLKRHVEAVFRGANKDHATDTSLPEIPAASASDLALARKWIARAERPLMIVGSQTMLDPTRAQALVKAINAIGVPCYLSGMARGLLGAKHPLLSRHKRKEALKRADAVILLGVPCDFRLDYGRHIRRTSRLIAINRSRRDLLLNRIPSLGILGDPGSFLLQLAEGAGKSDREPWREELKKRDEEREGEIDAMAKGAAQGVNPVALCREMDKVLDDDSALVADGGDFVGTASYTVAPRGPLSWLDPGVFGTLGVGAGFALGAKLCRPTAEVWILYGDGSVGFSLSEFDTFCRHKIGVIAVVGNDASWMQIARDQVDFLKDDVGTVLRHTDYHKAAEGLGGKGFYLDDLAQAASVFKEAKQLARQGTPVLINVKMGKTEFRKGSISV